MHQPNRLVKAAVLASSITLLAALVAYRANAFPWQSAVEPVAAELVLGETSTVEALSSPGEPLPMPNVDINPFDTPRTPFDDAAAARATATVSASGSDGAFLSSSKSGAVFLPPESIGSGSGSTIMYSSKDGVVFPPNSPIASANAGAVMSGSKSDRVIVPQQPKKVARRATAVMPGSKSAAVIPPAPNSATAPAKTGSDAMMMSSSKSIILAPPPTQAAANSPPGVRSQRAQRARQSQAQELRP
jgi:hypothetical protein